MHARAKVVNEASWTYLARVLNPFQVHIHDDDSGGIPMGTQRHRYVDPELLGDGGEKRSLERGLGWFSIGLGVAQLASPGGVARLSGLRDDDRNRSTMRALGLRELASGLGILGRRRPAGFLWARVIGDAMDLAILGRSFSSRSTDRDRLLVAMAAVGGVAALDMLSAYRQTGRQRAVAELPGRVEGKVSVTKLITVNRPVEDVYAFWRNFENLPRFMAHLESVEQLGGNRSRWCAKAIAGKTVEWEAEIVDERPNESISWRSLPGADVPNRGSVRFTPAPGGRGTEIRVDLEYDPPAGKLGAAVAKLFGREPGQQTMGDLRRFKQVMETGEVVHSDASIHRGMHPARPSQTTQASRAMNTSMTSKPSNGGARS